jgi:predicted flavoprotein YhiN
MVDFNRKFDVLVIGGGNAALCAAISARRLGASVLVASSSLRRPLNSSARSFSRSSIGRERCTVHRIGVPSSFVIAGFVTAMTMLGADANSGRA